MTNLSKKLIRLFSSLNDTDFFPSVGTILLQNDSDGRGDYIAKWEHPDYPRPTDEQLAAIKDAE